MIKPRVISIAFRTGDLHRAWAYTYTLPNPPEISVKTKKTSKKRKIRKVKIWVVVSDRGTFRRVLPVGMDRDQADLAEDESLVRGHVEFAVPLK